MNCYRPGPGSRRNSGRGFDLPNDDRDRRPRDRDRDREHERELFPPPRDEVARTNTDQATTEIKNLTLRLYEAQADKSKWVLKKENVLKDLRRNEADFKKAGGGAQFPAVEELFRKQQITFKTQQDECDKEIAKCEALLNQLAESYASSLVKHLPVGEIRARQLSDMVKAEVVKDSKTTSPDPRFPALQGQVASLQNTQQTQTSDIHRLNKEHGQLRTRSSTSEANFAKHATEIASLKTRYDQLHTISEAKATEQAVEQASFKTQFEHLQSQLDNPKADSEIKTLRQDKEALESDVARLQTALAALVQKVDSQQAQFKLDLQEVRMQKEAVAAPAPAPAPVDGVSGQELTLLEQAVKEIAAWKDKVKEHETRLASFDPQDYEEGRTKLLCFPDWEHVEARITDGFKSHKEEIERMKSNTASARDMQAVSESVAKVEANLNQNFKAFADKTLDVLGPGLEEVQTRIFKGESELSKALHRIKDLEGWTTSASAAQTRSTSSGQGNASSSGNRDASESTAALAALSSRVQTMEVKLTNMQSGLQNDLSFMRNEYATYATTLGAHETMIMSLDDQFKNMTTSQMAQIILEYLRKMLPGTVSLDVQNINERLGALEAFMEHQSKRNHNVSKWALKTADELDNKKRGCVEDNEVPQEKRQRREGLSELVNSSTGYDR